MKGVRSSNGFFKDARSSSAIGKSFFLATACSSGDFFLGFAFSSFFFDFVFWRGRGWREGGE